MDPKYGAAIDDEKDPLVGELKRVRSDLSFREWTKHRLVGMALLVILDLVLSVVAVTALVQVRQQPKKICDAQNELRAAETRLWTGVSEKNPIPPLKANATAEQRVVHARQVRTTNQFLGAVKRDFAPISC